MGWRVGPNVLHCSRGPSNRIRPILIVGVHRPSPSTDPWIRNHSDKIVLPPASISTILVVTFIDCSAVEIVTGTVPDRHSEVLCDSACPMLASWNARLTGWMSAAYLCLRRGNEVARGNSGVFLTSTGPEDAGYELQILDSYNNKTYVNGQAGSIYKQGIPLVNPNRKPGEWQTYDVVWTAPTFNDDGSLKTPAYVTVFFNGVLAQNHFELKGQTLYVGHPFYKKYDTAPIKLQAHGDDGEQISFRNIWVRELN
jgi:Domain of Unknown Function (DUF1080)